MISTIIIYILTGILFFFGAFYFCTLPFGGLNEKDNTDRGLRFLVCVGFLFAAYITARLGGI
jgi:hypothetical protein